MWKWDGLSLIFNKGTEIGGPLCKRLNNLPITFPLFSDSCCVCVWAVGAAVRTACWETTATRQLQTTSVSDLEHKSQTASDRKELFTDQWVHLFIDMINRLMLHPYLHTSTALKHKHVIKLHLDTTDWFVACYLHLHVNVNID